MLEDGTAKKVRPGGQPRSIAASSKLRSKVASRDCTTMVTKHIAPDLRAWLVEQNLLMHGPDAASLIVNHCSIDWRDVLGRVDVPTLVVGGRASHVSVRSQEWIHSRVKGSELVVFGEQEGGSHFPFIENPPAFNAVLRRFLDRHAAPARGDGGPDR